MQDGPDWGAYQAGALTPEERAELDALLERDPAARLEFENFTNFASAVKHAALAEPVPLAHLESSLRGVARSRPRRATVLALAIAACIAVAVLWAGFQAITYDRMALATTPTIEKVAADSPRAATQWVNNKTQLKAPEVDLRGARIVGARYGEGWACYDYELEGEHYFLYMSRSIEPVMRGEVAHIDGKRVYRGKGVGWVSGDLAFYLKGGEVETRDQLARLALATTTP